MTERSFHCYWCGKFITDKDKVVAKIGERGFVIFCSEECKVEFKKPIEDEI